MTLDGFFFYKTTYLLIIKLLKIDVHEYKISYLNVSIKKKPYSPGTSEFLGVFLWESHPEHSRTFLGCQETSGDPEKVTLHSVLQSELPT